MSAPDMPPWVAPTTDEVGECWRVTSNHLHGGGVDERDDGVFHGLAWLIIGEVAPVTERPTPVTWEAARAESWAALCAAAGQDPPTPEEWERLGVEPGPSVSCDREFAYGAWRALSWLLGVREDWPMHTAWHRAAGIAPERPHLYAPRSARDTAAWRAADQAARDGAQQDALRHWRHVRARVDATRTG